MFFEMRMLKIQNVEVLCLNFNCPLCFSSNFQIEILVNCQLTVRQKLLYQNLRRKISIDDLMQSSSTVASHSQSATSHLMNLVMQFRKVKILFLNESKYLHLKNNNYVKFIPLFFKLVGQFQILLLTNISSSYYQY